MRDTTGSITHSELPTMTQPNRDKDESMFSVTKDTSIASSIKFLPLKKVKKVHNQSEYEMPRFYSSVKGRGNLSMQMPAFILGDELIVSRTDLNMVQPVNKLQIVVNDRKTTNLSPIKQHTNSIVHFPNLNQYQSQRKPTDGKLQNIYMDENQLAKLKTAKKNLKLMRLKNAEQKKSLLDTSLQVGTRRSAQSTFADLSQQEIGMDRIRKHGSSMTKSIRSDRHMVADSR